VAWRVAGAARSRPPLEPDAEPLGEVVTVIVPARDEEHRLPRLLDALGLDPTPHEVIVVDDESTDRTARIASDAGATVVAGRPLPLGWVGKPWALQQGLDVATGSWVVTLDADTVPRPGLLAALVRRTQADGWDLLSVAARFECDGIVQPMVHAAMLTTLVYRFGAPGAPRAASPHRTLANGQCWAFRRDALRAVGGFAGAATHLTDDVALARHLAALGWRVGFLDGTRVIDVRMHESAADTWRSWGRSLPMVDVTTRWWRLADAAVVALAQALPLLRVVARRGDALDVALLLLRAGTLAGTQRAYRHAGVGYWLSPLADGPVAARLVQATLRPERTWRGRTYPDWRS
jgi:dolichol-phosphate mannosyltransferase